MPRVVVIYNPIAGGSQGERISAAVEKRLRDAGHVVERMATRDRRGAAPIAADVAERADRIVAVGGDGTLREVVDGLGTARSRVVVGVVPMGNANIVARELRIPRDADDAIGVLIEGEPVDLDVGVVRTDAFEELFLGVVGVGWDAEAVRLLDAFRHTRVGRRGYRIWADGLYGAAGLAATFRPGQARFTVEADGRPMSDRRYCAAFLCNLRTYGKSMAVTPEAHHASGLLHAQARKTALPPTVLLQLGAALAGRRSPKFISDYADAKEFVVRGEDAFPIQVDGDARGHATELAVEVMPKAARILAPSRRARRSPGA